MRRHDGGGLRHDRCVGDLEGGERSERLGDDHRVVTCLEDELGLGIHERVTAAVHGQQRRSMVTTEPCGEVVDR